MNERERLQLAREVFARTMNRSMPTWRVEGDRVVGPGTSAVYIECRHDVEHPEHLDIGFHLKRDEPESDGNPVCWDCVSGLGETLEAAFEQATEVWRRTTCPVFIELCNQNSGEAMNLIDDKELAPGWHVIHGLPVAVGRDGNANQAIANFILDAKVLAVIGPPLTLDFTRPRMNFVKVFYLSGGEPVAEVRLNGERHDAASEVLASLHWPDVAVAVVRCGILYIHPETPDSPCVSSAELPRMSLDAPSLDTTLGQRDPIRFLLLILVIIAIAAAVGYAVWVFIR